MNSVAIRTSIGAGLLSLALSFALVPVTPLSAQAPAGPVDAAGNLDKAVAALRAISTMRADFLQTDRNGQRVTGVLTLKRPGKIRFQYEKNIPLLIVADGRALTMVDYEVRQVQRWPIKNSPLAVLLDPDRDVTRYGKLLPTQHPDVVSIEVRDAKRPEYGTITMIFIRNAAAPGGLELTSWVALDSQNKRTTVRLTGHQYGVEVPDSAFTYKDPRPGARPGRR